MTTSGVYSRRAVTLIEMLVVIAIIAILASLRSISMNGNMNGDSSYAALIEGTWRTY